MPVSYIRFHVVECNASFSCKEIAMIRYGFFTVLYGRELICLIYGVWWEHAKELILYFTWPLPVTLLRVLTFFIPDRSKMYLHRHAVYTAAPLQHTQCTCSIGCCLLLSNKGGGAPGAPLYRSATAILHIHSTSVWDTFHISSIAWTSPSPFPYCIAWGHNKWKEWLYFVSCSLPCDCIIVYWWHSFPGKCPCSDLRDFFQSYETRTAPKLRVHALLYTINALRIKREPKWLSWYTVKNRTLYRVDISIKKKTALCYKREPIFKITIQESHFGSLFF